MAPRAHDTNSTNSAEAISSQTHEPCDMHDNEWVTYSRTIRYCAPNGGTSGIIVEHRDFEDGEPGPWSHRVTLPPVAGRFEGSEGLIYIIPKPWGGMGNAKANELRKGDPWLMLGYDEAHAEMTGQDGKTLWAIWFRIANAWPVSGISPRVTQGHPPLAPELIPVNDDRKAAERSLREVGKRMSPVGRAIMGEAIGSPWLPEVGGESLIMHAHGEAGSGKSMTGRASAGLFGDPRNDEGLFSSFNSSGQGLTAWAQNLSYFPMVLDEVQSSTSSPEEQMTSLIMGASRKRATRSGQAAGGRAGWRGLIISTGNDRLDVKHEMYDRRLMQIEAGTLWDGYMTEDQWAEVWGMIMAYAGHPWAEMSAMFTPGQPSAAEFNSMVTQVPRPGPGVLGTAGRVAVAGSWVLGDISGMDWADGVWDAWAGLIVAKAEQTRNPARDVARAIIDSLVTNSHAWVAQGEFGGRDLIGQPAKTTEGKHCQIEHEGRCHWLDVFDGPFDVLSDGLSRERLGKTKFRQALLSPTENRLSRRVRLSGGIRATVLTVCAGALDVLGEAQAVPTWEAGEAERIEVPAQPELPEPKPEPRPTLMHIGGDDLLASVNEAADAGATDVAVSHGPDVNSVKDEWNTTWLGSASGMMDRKRDGARLRVWPAPHTGLTAQEWGDAVVAYRAKHPTFISPSQRVHELLIEGDDDRREPRWQLPSEQAKLWMPGEVAHPAGWQSKADVPDDHIQYDRNKAHLSAIGQANLAPLFRGESFEVYGPDAPVDSKHAGMYRIIVPEWNSILPGPLGNTKPGAELWTTAEIMRLFAEADMRPEVIEAHLAPVHRISQVRAAQRTIKTELRRSSNRPERVIPKFVYQAFAGSIASEYAQGKRGRVYRPDWAQAIRDNAWATVVRSAWRIHAADARFIPRHVNVDALYYPAGLGEVPVIKIGNDLGEWKVES